MPKDSVVHTIASEQVTMVRFANGWMWIQSPRRDAGDSFLRSFVKYDKSTQSLLDNGSPLSEFQLMQAAMSTIPRDVKWWRFRLSQNRRAVLLLEMKFFALIEASHASRIHGPIYAMSIGEMREFQFGDTNTPPYEAHLDLFDKSDRHFILEIMGPQGHGQILTQAEINAVVESIRPMPVQ